MDTSRSERADRSGWSEQRAARWEALVEEVRRRVGPGARLESGTRRFFEGQLGEDLGGVMVHRGPFAGYLASGLRAEAATVDGHVFGSDERLNTDTPEGAALMGHELVHASSAFAPVSGPSAGEAPAIQRAAMEEEEDGDEREERFARSMETMIGEIVSGMEQEEEERPRRRRRAPISTSALAERVYDRLRDALLYERERGAW